MEGKEGEEEEEEEKGEEEFFFASTETCNTLPQTEPAALLFEGEPQPRCPPYDSFLSVEDASVGVQHLLPRSQLEPRLEAAGAAAGRSPGNQPHPISLHLRVPLRLNVPRDRHGPAFDVPFHYVRIRCWI